MIVVGLTGSIATGKTFVARCFSKLGVPVFDADECVHQLIGFGGKAVSDVARHFPETFRDSQIDREKLGTIVFKDACKMKILEGILHPLVREAEEIFIYRASQQRQKFVVLEIPLLYEKGGRDLCDYVIVTTTTAEIQEARALKRPGMNKLKLRAILSRQLPDEQKVNMADYVVDTSVSEFSVFRQVRQLIDELASRNARNCI